MSYWKVTELDLAVLALEARGAVDKVYLHWTAGHYGQIFDEYHLLVDADGSVYAACGSFREHKTHTWRRNGRSIGIALCGAYRARASLPGYTLGQAEPPLERAQVLISRLPGMIDFGPEPPLPAQLEALARVVALVCRGLQLPIDTDTVMTHCEAALEDGYGPCSNDPETRWDLWFLPNADPGADAALSLEAAQKREAEAFTLTPEDAGGRAVTLIRQLPLSPGGALLRGKAQWYAEQDRWLH